MASYKIISFVIAQVPEIKRGEAEEARPAQSAPAYAYSLPKQFTITMKTERVNSHDARIRIKAYHPNTLLVEAEAEVMDIFSHETFKLRELLIDRCQEVIKQWGGRAELSEEYSLAIVSGYKGAPEQFLNKRAEIVSFLKSETLPLNDDEIEHTLSKQIKYGKEDLVILDWDGAFIFEPDGNVDYTVDLFEAANFQLTRYRHLDALLDQRLKKVSESINTSKKVRAFAGKDLNESYESVIKLRTKAIAEFGALEREIKLIGDWYSARLYELMAKKFRIPDWREAIKAKLDSLEDIYDIISNNFSVSKLERLEWIQIALWFVLQLGWFVLIFFEFKGVFK